MRFSYSSRPTRMSTKSVRSDADSMRSCATEHPNDCEAAVQHGCACDRGTCNARRAEGHAGVRAAEDACRRQHLCRCAAQAQPGGGASPAQRHRRMRMRESGPSTGARESPLPHRRVPCARIRPPVTTLGIASRPMRHDLRCGHRAFVSSGVRRRLRRRRRVTNCCGGAAAHDRTRDAGNAAARMAAT